MEDVGGGGFGGGGFGESGGYGIEGGGGYGGYGGAFGGTGFSSDRDFRDALDAVENEIATALARDREQERVGRFSFTPSVYGVAPAPRSVLSRLRDWGVQKGLGYLSSRIPGFGGVLTTAGQGLYSKMMGKTEEEINQQAFGNIMNTIVGPIAMPTEMVGRFAQWGGRKLGFTGGPQPTFGEQPATPGYGLEAESPVAFDRGVLQGPSYDLHILDKRPQQITQLLRQAKTGRV
jgi:hypothetical protein